MAGRLIVDPPAGGAWNMAVDEALLHSAATTAQWTLRFYKWSSPTLSLGYFQRYLDRQHHADSQSVQCVRRSTGGGAILHDQEITYSLTCPAGDRVSQRNEELYFAVHRSLRLALAEQGISVGLHPGLMRDKSAEPFLCFQRRAHGDVVFGDIHNENHKICGSAQRRWKTAILQHGSLILRTSASAPRILGLAEVAGRQIQEARLLVDWAGAVSAELQQTFQSAKLTDREIEDSERISTEKYSADSWTRKK